MFKYGELTILVLAHGSGGVVAFATRPERALAASGGTKKGPLTFS